MRTKRKYADTGDSTSESDLDHSHNTHDDQEAEHKIDPWTCLKMEVLCPQNQNVPFFVVKEATGFPCRHSIVVLAKYEYSNKCGQNLK